MDHDTQPLWNEIALPYTFPLTSSIETDVCVIGGGIAGLTAAYLLLKEGQKVCVLESSKLGNGQTGRTTAQFVTALDERYFTLEKYHGEDITRKVAQSHIAAIKKVIDIVKNENIECNIELVDGYLFSTLETSEEVLFKELTAARRMGLLDVTIVTQAPLESFDTGPALCFPDQLELHPMKYLNGLAQCILKGSGKIFTETHIVEVHGGDAAYVKTQEGFYVNAKNIVVATNSPINDIFAIHTKQAPYRSYVLTFEIPRASVAKGLYWDTLDPYHYVRTAKSELNDKDFLIVGGEDHKTGQNKNPEDCFKRLENWTRRRFSMVGALVNKWSGQVMEPVDGLAYLGHNPMDRENVYVITGHSGTGMTYSTIGALLITDQIMGRKNDWEAIYNPSRVNLHSIGTFLKENLNAASQYKEWFTAKQNSDLENLRHGEGLVLRKGLKPIAAYKNTSGQLELRSATCPHLGCVVAWNTVEKSWDCPCHGSRFNCDGRVVEGPAVKDLALINSLDIFMPGTHILPTFESERLAHDH